MEQMTPEQRLAASERGAERSAERGAGRALPSEWVQGCALPLV